MDAENLYRELHINFHGDLEHIVNGDEEFIKIRISHPDKRGTAGAEHVYVKSLIEIADKYDCNYNIRIINGIISCMFMERGQLI